MWVIGDVAGQLQALANLVHKIDKGGHDIKEIVLVGDLIDRGPDSRGVIDFVRSEGLIALYGNHEDMMVDWVEYRTGERDHRAYEWGCWERNGGIHTLRNYGFQGIDHNYEPTQELRADAYWLSKLPRTYLVGDRTALVTHAPQPPGPLQPDSETFTWHRDKPPFRPYFQFFGHNGRLYKVGNERGDYGMCVDSSRDRVLTAVHWPSFEILEEAYPELC